MYAKVDYKLHNSRIFALASEGKQRVVLGWICTVAYVLRAYASKNYATVEFHLKKGKLCAHSPKEFTFSGFCALQVAANLGKPTVFQSN